MDVAWEAGEIFSAAIRPVVGGGGQERAEVARCVVLSRSRLSVVQGGGVPPVKDVDGVYEGGAYWYAIGMGSLGPGEEVRLSGVAS